VDHLGDGGVASSSLTAPASLAFVPSTTPPVWLVTDTLADRVRAIDLGDSLRPGTVSSVVGYPQGFAITSAGIAARYCRLLSRPNGMAFNPASQELFLSETGGHSILRVSLATKPWTITRYAGAFQSGFFDGPAASSRFDAPGGLALDLEGQILYVADTLNRVVRSIDLASGQVSLVAGTPTLAGDFGDGVPAQQALLASPVAIAVGRDGVST